jgi:hypothetical protein
MLKLTTNTLAAALLLALMGSLGAAAAAAQDQIGPSPATGRDAITVVACVTREADYARATPTEAKASAQPQLLLVMPDSGTPTYSLTGVRELELAPHVGERLEITGTVEPASAVGVLITADGKKDGSITTETGGAAGVTPSGAPAHEPGDARSDTVETGIVPAAGTSGTQDPTYQAAALPRLNATAFRRMAGTCVAPAAEATASAVQPSPAAEPEQRRAPTPQLSTREPQSITAVGCLVQQTPTGSERAPQGVDGETLVLIDVSLPDARPAAGGSAVPGSSPSGSGSGTLPEAARTTGNAPVDTGRLAFVLAAGFGETRELTQHVGRRVEIIGTVDEGTPARSGNAAPRPSPSQPDPVGTSGRIEPAPAVAHPSAPTRMTVTSFRVLAGGTCN